MDSVQAEAPVELRAETQAEAQTGTQSGAQTEAQAEEQTGLPQLYLQMKTSKVKTWAEAQAEPTQLYMRLQRETQAEEQTVAQTEAQAGQPQWQLKVQARAHALADAKVQAQAEALAEAQPGPPQLYLKVQARGHTQAEAQVQTEAQTQAKRAVKRPRGGKAAVSNDAPGTKTGQTRAAREECRRDGGQQRVQRQDEAEHRRGGETRSQAKMVDRNNGSANVFSTSSRSSVDFGALLNLLASLALSRSSRLLRPAFHILT